MAWSCSLRDFQEPSLTPDAQPRESSAHWEDCWFWWRYGGFPGSSAGNESACNARDPGSIPVSGKSPGEGIGYPLPYSWASLVAQVVKNLPVMWETWVWSLGWEAVLEEGMATHFSILSWRIPMDRGAWWATVYGVTKSQTWLSDSAQHMEKGPWLEAIEGMRFM